MENIKDALRAFIIQYADIDPQDPDFGDDDFELDTPSSGLSEAPTMEPAALDTQAVREQIYADQVVG